jgi:hypothetical protein
MRLGQIADKGRLFQGGVWKPIAALPGVEVKVRGLHSVEDKHAEARARRAFGDVTIGDEENEKIVRTRLIEAILIDWRGLERDDGSPLSYSREEAERMLTDPEYHFFRQGVFMAALSVANGETASLEADAKN